MTTTTANPLYDFTGNYGQEWREGVVIDHLRAAQVAGCLVHEAPSGRRYVTGPRGGHAVPVVCGEVIQIDTEDGPISGRCGKPLHATEWACYMHS
jgi:hypothetical protein